MMRTTRSCNVAVTALALAACAIPPSERADPPGTSMAAIWDGVPGNGPVVRVESGNERGSGVALNNNWVITALHTVRGRDWADARALVGGAPPLYSPTFATTITDSAWGWGAVTGTEAWDLALLRFTDMPIGGSTTGYKTPIFTRDPTQPGTITDQIVALGQVECWGYGLGGPAGNPGTLRYATLDIKHDNVIMKLDEFANLIHMTAPINFFTTPTDGKQIAKGDSGGACFRMTDHSLVGVIRAIETTAPDPAPRGVITSVGAYSNDLGNLDKQLQLIVDRNPRTAHFGDVDGDGNPDLLAVSVEGGYLRFQMQLTNAVFPPGGFVDFNDMGLLSALIPAGLADTVLAAMGDFDGDGFADVFGLWDGDTVYLDGRPGMAPTIHVDDSPSCTSWPFDCRIFQPPSVTFRALRVADLNGDGFDDLEGFVEGESAPVVYYGSERGLTTPTYVSGFPTSDGGDGKLLVLAPPPGKHVGVPDYTFQLATYHSAAGEPDPATHRLHVEVFDGDMVLSHDRTWLPGGGNSEGARTCFILYADKYASGKGLNDAPIYIRDDSHFRNNRWWTLFDSATIPEDPNASGGVLGGWFAYNYLLRVFLTTGSCNQAPVYPSGDDVANGLKIRTNGHIFFWDSGGAGDGLIGGVTVVGSDNVGPFATKDTEDPPPYLGLYEGFDTAYDGRWRFNIATTLSLPDGPEFGGQQPVEQFWLSEADADSLLNPLSPQSPHAIAANEEINFAVLDDHGHSFFQPAYPSGQYDPPQAPCVSYLVTPSTGHPFPAKLFWVWSDVMSRNYLWLAAPTAQAPGTCVESTAGPSSTQSSYSAGEPLAILRMAGEKPRIVVPTTSAKPISDWISGEGRQELADLLPIFLGVVGQVPHANQGHKQGCGDDGFPPGNGGTVKVRQLQQALRILRMDGAHPHDLSAPGLIRSLEAELLTAKLNLARAESRGEDIARGYVYGRVERVSDVVDRADETLTEARRGMRCTSLAEIVDVVSLLQAVNYSNITYRPPLIPAPNTLNLRSGGTPSTTPLLWQVH